MRLCVVGEEEEGLAVRAVADGVGGVAGAAVHTELGGPGAHDGVDLFAGGVFGEDFEIDGGGKGRLGRGGEGEHESGGEVEDGLHAWLAESTELVGGWLGLWLPGFLFRELASVRRRSELGS